MTIIFAELISVQPYADLWRLFLNFNVYGRNLYFKREQRTLFLPK